MTQHLEIYTDGSCSLPHGKGGWAFTVYSCDGTSYSRSGRDQDTTNNRMELQALIEALKVAVGTSYVPTGEQVVTIHCDSTYVVKGYNEWLSKWATDSVRMSVLKNKDLWLQVVKLKESIKSNITVKWIKAHKGNARNEAVDKLAKEARDYNL